MNTVASPLKWHGGKSYLAARIVAMMPAHTHYVEAYAGGLSVLLAKNPDGVSEVVNDLDGELSAFWRVLQGEATYERFRRRMERTPFSERSYQEAVRGSDTIRGCFGKGYGVVGDAEFMAACHFFVRCRQSLAGRMEAFAPLSRNRTRRGMNEQASAWLSAVEGLPAVHARLKRVVVLNRDALDVIRQQDGPNTLFYADPPYCHSTRATTKEYGEHEMSDDMHAALLGVLGAVKGRFILSGYRCDLYDAAALKYGWKREDIEIANNSAGGTKKRRMIESLWMNY